MGEVSGRPMIHLLPLSYLARQNWDTPTPWEPFPLIAAARYLAAHAPTRRAQEQIYRIAERLRRGERLYEDA